MSSFWKTWKSKLGAKPVHATHVSGLSDDSDIAEMFACKFATISNSNKNSSGDEIANVNFLRRYGTYVLQNTKKENLLRLTN